MRRPAAPVPIIAYIPIAYTESHEHADGGAPLVAQHLRFHQRDELIHVDEAVPGRAGGGAVESERRGDGQ